MTIQQLEVHLAALLGLLGFCVSLYVVWKDKRVVSTRVQWRWTPANPPDHKAKLLTVFVVNQKPRPVTVRYVILEATDAKGAAFKQAIWREGSRNQVGKLTESDYVWADYATADWRRVRHIYAIDADGNRWHAPRSQLRSVRDENDPKGTVEEFGIRPCLQSDAGAGGLSNRCLFGSGSGGSDSTPSHHPPYAEHPKGELSVRRTYGT